VDVWVLVGKLVARPGDLQIEQRARGDERGAL
jgi:hypothetical protein